ncbi:MAG: hypothetical protein SNH27_16280 [Rikenellaceae bacterium]
MSKKNYFPDSLSEKIDKLITITHRSYEFNGKPVTFQLSTLSIFVNARDILKTHFDEQLMEEDGEFIESVFSYFKVSEFDKDYCLFEVNEKTLEFEIWMSDDCAEAFCRWINPKMGDWCKGHIQSLTNNKKEILTKARAEQDAAKEESPLRPTSIELLPEGEAIVTYSYKEQPVKFHLKNGEIYINASDMGRIISGSEPTLINIPHQTLTN